MKLRYQAEPGKDFLLVQSKSKIALVKTSEAYSFISL
jgi:hypothetical protein